MAGGKSDILTRRSGDLPKEGDERLLTNRHAILKPQNLIDLPNTGQTGISDAVRNPLELLILRIYAGWIGVSDIVRNPSELSDLQSGSRQIDFSDTGRLDVLDIVNRLNLMANDMPNDG